ncbi:MAG: hypothetical protein KDA80_16545 [Planctomycetaceae bacterium]|nr:hypothetical protein [Planctomycetaceae bacterium]
MFGWKHMSLVLMVGGVLAGCTESGDGYRELGEVDDVTNTAPPEHHHHHESGPHGGHILEFGEYHGEITMDESRVVSVYVLGDDAETAVPLAEASAVLHLHQGEEELEIDLVAAPLEGEGDGMSSRFQSAAAALPDSVKDLEGIHGEVVLKTGDKSFTAKVEHDHGHDDHGHDH